MNVVLTGVSRGIGLALTKIGLENGHSIIGFSRQPQKSEELLALKERYPEKLHFYPLDLSEKDAISKLVSLVNWDTVDIVFNNAGIYRDDDSFEDFEASFKINAITPFFITRSLLTKMHKSSRPVSVQITSLMGSIAENSSGGSYSYRASKTALNMLFKSLTIDESWLISLLIHPGWVKTNMGGTTAPTLPEDSASGIWRLVENAEQSDSGCFQDYRGNILPW